MQSSLSLRHKSQDKPEDLIGIRHVSIILKNMSFVREFLVSYIKP